jgi:hypothetical protein
MKKIIQNTAFAFSLIAMASCGDGGKSNGDPKDSTEVVEMRDSLKDIVLYNIPSPLETFTILKMYGPGFDKSLINPATNISKYVSNTAKSVNLGIYSTDLSFCFLYKQNEGFNNYLKNINELTTALGVDASYGQSITDRLKANSNNMDSLMNIVTEASVNADLYLKENQRNSTTILIAAGTWIEAMHIITSIANKTPNEAITSLVADQKIAIRNLSKMLGEFPEDADISSMLKDIQDISAVYDGLKQAQGNSLVSEDKLLRSIGNNTSYELSKEQIATIYEKVETLRNKLIN